MWGFVTVIVVAFVLAFIMLLVDRDDDEDPWW